MNRKLVVLPLLLAVGLAGTLPLQAASVFWGPADGDFSTPGNWLDATGNPLTTFPGTGDDLSIQSSNADTGTWYQTLLGATTPLNGVNNLYVGSLKRGATPEGAGWLVQTGQTLNVYNQVVIGAGPSGVGHSLMSGSEYDISGGTLNVSPDPSLPSHAVSLLLGNPPGIISKMKISGTAEVKVVSSDHSGWLLLEENYFSTAIIEQSGSSSVTVTSGAILGDSNGGATGYYKMSGGSFTAQSAGGAATIIGQAGWGLIEQSGGTFTVLGETDIARLNFTNTGVLKITGGTYQTDTCGIGLSGTGVVNVSGTGILSARAIGFGGNLQNAPNRIASGTGILNIGTGGTVVTSGMAADSAPFLRPDGTTVIGQGQLNFHGGTLRANANNPYLLDYPISGSAGAVKTYVYPEGGTIDTNGHDVTINNPIMAPTGSGVSGVSFDPRHWNNRYASPPIVSFSRGAGDTTGTGAAGYAVLNEAGNLTNIVITNPGVDYAAAPTITLTGGLYGAWWDQTHVTSTLAANDTTGGLKKTGSGTLTLAGACTYAGDTEILEGTLAIGYNSLTGDGSINYSPNIIVSPGATFDVSTTSSMSYTLGSSTSQTLRGGGSVNGTLAVAANGAINPGSSTAGQTLTFNYNLDLASAAGGKLVFDLSASAAGANDKIVVANFLSQPTSGTVNVVFHGLGTTLDTSANYSLVGFGGFSGSDLSTFNLINNTRYTASLVLDDTTANDIELHVTGTGPLALTWYGHNTQIWDTKSHTPWNTDTQQFYEMDSVTFGNSTFSTGTLPVTVTGEVYPSSITVNNDVNHNYNFTGTGKITGSTGISKSGAGTLTLGNTGGNDFTGAVTITGGTLKLGSPTALGSTVAGTTVSGGGTLDLNDQTPSAGEIVTISGAGINPTTGALINSGSVGTSVLTNLTVAGNASIGGSGNWALTGAAGSVISNAGGYTLTKEGAGTVTLDNIGDAHLPAVVVNGGTLFAKGATNLGSANVTLAHGGTIAFSNALHPVNVSATLQVDATGGTLSTIYNGVADNDITFTGNATLNGTLTVQTNHCSNINLAGNYSGPGGMHIAPTADVYSEVTISGNNTYHGGTQVGLLGVSVEWMDYYLNSSSGWAIPGDLTMDGDWTWVGLQQGEENGGQAQMNPAGVITFAVGGTKQYLALDSHTLRVAGVVNHAAADDTSYITNYYGSPMGTLILDTPSGATYSYRGRIDDTRYAGGLLALIKTGLGTQILLGEFAGNFSGGTTVEGGILDVTGVANFTPDGTITVQKTGTLLADTLTVPSITVLDDGVLTANSVTTDSLTIGGSSAATLATVPEPGTLVLATLAGVGMLFVALRKRLFRS
jgi:fibronectin-binding autotransporter adhesin